MHIFDFDFMGHFWRDNGRSHLVRPLCSMRDSQADQNVGSLGGPFGPLAQWTTAISK